MSKSIVQRHPQGTGYKTENNVNFRLSFYLKYSKLVRLEIYELTVHVNLWTISQEDFLKSLEKSGCHNPIIF